MRLPNGCEILISHFPVLLLAQESGNAQAHYNMVRLIYCYVLFHILYNAQRRIKEKCLKSYNGLKVVLELAELICL
jgi:hypothetical protein